jgi:AcrR family transcriptional regulator
VPLAAAELVADPALGRRDRKKLETRRALAEAAIALFDAQGFEDTTVEEIAEAVDVSRRTFHRYFARKEDVLFADASERLGRFRATLHDRPPGEAVATSVRVALRELASDLSLRPEVERTRFRLIASSPSLRAHHLRYQDELAAAVADFAATRARPGGDPAWPALVGSCTLAVATTMRRRWTAGEADGELVDAIEHGVDLLGDLFGAEEEASRG